MPLAQAPASSLGIELLYLPGYSPNLNLIERLWRFVRRAVAGLHLLRRFRAIHGCDRSVPGRSAHSPQGRDGNSNDSQVPDVWRCATIGRVEYTPPIPGRDRLSMRKTARGASRPIVPFDAAQRGLASEGRPVQVRRLSRKPRVRPRREKSPERCKRRAEQAWGQPYFRSKKPRGTEIAQSHDSYLQIIPVRYHRNPPSIHNSTKPDITITRMATGTYDPT